MRYVGGFSAMLLAVAFEPVGARPGDVPRFVSVTAGADHVCALTEAGDAYCWGSNKFGQLGTGPADELPHNAPVRVASDVKFATVVAGFTHTCAISRDHVVYCWGANDTAQLGDGTLNASSTPVRVGGDIRFQAIGPGGTHTCAVSVDGEGYCWGGNWHGQLGVGNRDGESSAPCCFKLPTRIRTELRFRAAAAGGIHTCAIAVDGKAYCWGSPQEGRLGTGAADAANKSADKIVPTAVIGDVLFASLTPRSWHTCGLSTGGKALCWGTAGHGRLGSGSANEGDMSNPSRVAIDAEITSVAAGTLHNCALARNGTAFCWGSNASGALGDGTTQDGLAPKRVAIARRFSSIAAGGNESAGFSCGVTADDHQVLCWGDNHHGQLGNGSSSGSLAPIPVSVR